MPNVIKIVRIVPDKVSEKQNTELENIFLEATDKDNVEFLKNLAIEILTEIDNLKEPSNTNIKKRLVFFTLYTVTYIFATINLLGVARSADFNDSIDVFKKLSLVILASLAPGFMYLGGMQELMETTENYFKGVEKRLVPYLNKIRSSFAKTHGRDYFKVLVIGLFAVFSTILDATNAKTGVEAIAGKTVGIIAGIGNGIAESILPLFTLEELFRSIANNFKRLYLGAQCEEEELDIAVTAIEDFVDRDKKELGNFLSYQNELIKISAILKNMSSIEQLASVTKLMEKIRDSRQFALRLSRKIKGENPNLSNLHIRARAAACILANFFLSYFSAWIFSRGFSSSQIVFHYEAELSRYNFTLDNIYYLSQNRTNIAIEPFSPHINALNRLSYGLQGIAFLPLIGQTLFEVGNLFRFIFNACDRTGSNIANIKKALFASGIAGIGTACYVMLGLEAKKNYEIVQQLLEIEEFGVPQISFFPDFNLLPYFALLILVGIIYGGASNAAKKVYDAIPSPACFRKATSTDENKGRKRCFWQFFSSDRTNEEKEKKEDLSQQMFVTMACKEANIKLLSINGR